MRAMGKKGNTRVAKLPKKFWRRGCLQGGTKIIRGDQKGKKMAVKGEHGFGTIGDKP